MVPCRGNLSLVPALICALLSERYSYNPCNFVRFQNLKNPVILIKVGERFAPGALVSIGYVKYFCASNISFAKSSAFSFLAQ